MHARPRRAVPGFLEQHETGPFRDRNAVAPRIEGTARQPRKHTERLEAVQGGKTERVDTTHQSGVAQADRDGAGCIAEHFRAGRTGGRHDDRGAGEFECAPHVVGERIGVVRFAVVEARRQPARGVAPAIGEFGFEDARGAGGEEHADAIGAMAFTRGDYRAPEAVGLEAQLREANVATVEMAQPVGDAHLIHAAHFTDTRIERDGLEGARREAGAPCPQGGHVLCAAGTEAGDKRTGGERERLHGERKTVKGDRC